jgi:hypothetical protein
MIVRIFSTRHVLPVLAIPISSVEGHSGDGPRSQSTGNHRGEIQCKPSQQPLCAGCGDRKAPPCPTRPIAVAGSLLLRHAPSHTSPAARHAAGVAGLGVAGGVAAGAAAGRAVPVLAALVVKPPSATSGESPLLPPRPARWSVPSARCSAPTANRGTPPAARNAAPTRTVASCSPGRTALSTARTSVAARTVAPALAACNVAPSIPASRVNVSSPEARNPPREGRLPLAPRRRPTAWPLGLRAIILI